MERRRLLAVISLVAVIAGCSSDRSAEPPTRSYPGDPAFTEDAEFVELESEARRTLDELKEMASASSGPAGAMARGGAIVWVDPGADALEAAIAQAGQGGTVVLRSGLHTESETVTVDRRVNIVGEQGSILEVDTDPMFDYAVALEPALHILEASGTVIWGVTMRPQGPIGGTAVLVEDSQGVVLAFNTIVEHQYSLILVLSDRAVMLVTEMIVTDSLLD